MNRCSIFPRRLHIPLTPILSNPGQVRYSYLSGEALRQMLDAGMELLSNDLVQAAKLCEAAVTDLVAAYARGADIKEYLLERVKRIQALQEDVDEIAAEITARLEPGASDLRFVKSCRRITLEFSRLVKYAYDISDSISRRHAPNGDDESVKNAADRTRELVEIGIQSLRTRDSALAEQLRRMKVHVDRLSGEIDSSGAASSGLLLRYLEGVSAHAVSIGDSVLYVTAGEGS
jgi:phosphate transport system protein